MAPISSLCEGGLTVWQIVLIAQSYSKNIGNFISWNDEAKFDNEIT